MRTRKNKGFTLVEILIVVVILGILAAIVIPQFSNASTEAKLNSLCGNLQTLRSQVQLYKVQHGDTVPTAATQLTAATEFDGTAPEAGDTSFGPYMQSIPKNPYNQVSAITFGTDDPPTAPADNSGGWYINTTSGKVWAIDNDGTTTHLDK